MITWVGVNVVADEGVPVVVGVNVTVGNADRVGAGVTVGDTVGVTVGVGVGLAHRGVTTYTLSPSSRSDTRLSMSTTSSNWCWPGESTDSSTFTMRAISLESRRSTGKVTITSPSMAMPTWKG